MSRVSDSEVREIIDVDSSITDLTPFITAANLLVTEVCNGAGYSDTRLKEIERWLAAHFVAIRDPRPKEERAGVSASYHGTSGLFLNHTPYGQQVLLLDTNGGFAGLQNQSKKGRVTAGITYLGTVPETTEDEWD